MKKHPPKTRLGLVISPTDLAAIDRQADLEEISRASWARRVLRQRLRELAAAEKVVA